MTWRPAIRGTRHMIVAGHYLAAEAGFQILEAGGNAVDAGVAAGLALGVVQSELVNVAGVAPMMVYSAASDKVTTISGLGVWPKAASVELFASGHGGAIPRGLLRTVVPAAPDAWLTALAEYGTMSFGEVAAAAIRLAREGFVMYPLLASNLERHSAAYRLSPNTAAIYLPGGQVPAVGDVFVQSDLAGSLQYLVDEERAAKGGRLVGLAAARQAFYAGDIARTIVAYHEDNGGLLTMQDMGAFRVAIEPPVKATYHGLDVYTCGPWCQGPVLGQMLKLLEDFDLAHLGHNSAAYVHTVTEAMKLAFADREQYYGDPRFVDVPLQVLLGEQYAAARRKLIDAERAWPDMPPAGAVDAMAAPTAVDTVRGPSQAHLDTSYVCVVDKEGNAFSCTPSDVAHNSPIIPGTGLCPSSRGSQSWAVAGHPSAVAAGKRPRLTPNPAMAIGPGRRMPFGTPGGDVQCQAMLQTLLNMVHFEMDPQAAVEAPRFATFSFPDSFEPHASQPGVLRLESGIGQAAGERLAAMGHTIEKWGELNWVAGGMCVIDHDPQRQTLIGGADPRRPCYALGW